MAILDTIGLESNKLFKINFNGGDLSSDGGLLLIREFAAKIGFIRLIPLCPSSHSAPLLILSLSSLRPSSHPIPSMEKIRILSLGSAPSKRSLQSISSSNRTSGDVIRKDTYSSEG